MTALWDIFLHGLLKIPAQGESAITSLKPEPYTKLRLWTEIRQCHLTTQPREKALRLCRMSSALSPIFPSCIPLAQRFQYVPACQAPELLWHLQIL